MIYSNGSKIDQFGIVISGLLRAENYTSKGVELCNAYFECNDIFPEFLYFSGMRSYSYSLIAVKKSMVAWIPAHYFEKMLEEDADLMYSFMLYVCRRGLKNQLRIHCLNYQTIRERVAFWILGIQQYFESDGIIVSGSQRILANTLHVSRSSLNQELKKMEREGCFSVQDGKFIKIDQEKLRDIL